MSMRAIVLRAAGAFVMTTVLFAVAMIVAHGLAIPDPVGRMLPPTRAVAPAPADVAADDEQVTDDLALTVERMPRTLETADTPVAEVTAVPTPADPSHGDRAVALVDDADAGTDGTNDQRRADTGDQEPVGQQAGAPAQHAPADGDQQPSAARQRQALDEAQPGTTPAPASPAPDGGVPATAAEPQVSETPQPTAAPKARAIAPPAAPASPSPAPSESEPPTPVTQASSAVADPATDTEQQAPEPDHWWDLLFPGD